jgi:hypothetical protein
MLIDAAIYSFLQERHRLFVFSFRANFIDSTPCASSESQFSPLARSSSPSRKPIKISSEDFPSRAFIPRRFGQSLISVQSHRGLRLLLVFLLLHFLLLFRILSTIGFTNLKMRRDLPMP